MRQPSTFSHEGCGFKRALCVERGIHVHSPIRALGTFSWPEGRLILLVSLKGQRPKPLPPPLLEYPDPRPPCCAASVMSLAALLMLPIRGQAAAVIRTRVGS